MLRPVRLDESRPLSRPYTVFRSVARASGSLLSHLDTPVAIIAKCGYDANVAAMKMYESPASSDCASSPMD